MIFNPPLPPVCLAPKGCIVEIVTDKKPDGIGNKITCVEYSITIKSHHKKYVLHFRCP